MPDEKKPYRKENDEYIFETKDEGGNPITMRAKIASGGQTDVKIGADTLALFPERSSNARRIMALLEAERPVGEVEAGPG